MELWVGGATHVAPPHRPDCTLEYLDIHAALTNQELALAVTWLRGRKSETTMEDKLIVVVCGYPELYDITSYFYKNRNKFCNETGAAWQKGQGIFWPRSPSHYANSRLLCSECHARMKRISSANEASKLKMFKCPTMLK